MMENNKPAVLKLRFLAWLNDVLLTFLPTALLVLFVSSSGSLHELGYRLVFSVVVLLGPIMLVNFFYLTATTYWWGGSIGKILCGLNVIPQKDIKLTFKRLFFRYSIGYAFSFILFGAGFWAIIKDENKQGWHDKAVGSQVVVKNNWWPLSLIVFIVLGAINFFIISSAVHNFTSGPLLQEFSNNFPGKSSGL